MNRLLFGSSLTWSDPISKGQKHECVCVCVCLYACTRAQAYRQRMVRYRGYCANIQAKLPGGSEIVREYISWGHGNYATCHAGLNNFTDYSISYSTL